MNGPAIVTLASSFLAIWRCCRPESVVRKCRGTLLFFLPNHSRTRLPLPGFDACGRIIFGLLSHVTDDKYATLARSVDLRVLAPRAGTVPLQDKQHRLHVHFANGLWYRVSVLIPQIGVRASTTEVHETLVDLVDHTTSTG